MMIGDLTGLNIVISPDIQDTITANLKNVTVKAALDAILKPNNYSYFVQGNIIIVKDLDTQMIGELEAVVVKLKYINAKDLSAPLSAVMTSRGTIQSFILQHRVPRDLPLWRLSLMSRKIFPGS